MACSSPRTKGASPETDGGFATVTALGVSLALSMTVSLVLIDAEIELRQARKAMARSQAEYALDRAAVLAAYAARARLKDDDGAVKRAPSPSADRVTVHVELEAGKFGLGSAKDLPDTWLTALGVTDPDSLKAKLLALSKGPAAPTTTTIAALTDAPLWKRCAEDGVSPYGAASGASAILEGTPDIEVGGLPRVVRIVGAMDGWRDDRVVRLTADPAAPVILLDRRFFPQKSGGATCPPPPHTLGDDSLDIG